MKILDVGTGSGCIAVSIAKHVDSKKVTVLATDISDKALLVAKNNADNQNVKINFSQHNLFTKIPGKFDIIIANLPYVPISNYIILKESLAYEPKEAITDDTDNFLAITTFLKQAKSHLQTGSTIILETDPNSITILKKVIRNIFPKKSVKIYRDIHKLHRYIVIS